MTLYAIVLTYNESEHISACLAALTFADRRIVIDSFSTDDTIAKAQAAGAEVIQHAFTDYASQRNFALSMAVGRADWVIFVDADERLSPALADEIGRAQAAGSCAGYRIPRHNYIFNRLTLGAGWYPDYQTRLLKVGAARYDPERKVHEVVVLDGDLGTLTEPIVHYNYRDVAQFKAKQRRYSDYDAQIMFEQGIRPKLRNYLLQPLRHFRWRYLTLGGSRLGLHGLHLSLLMTYFEWRKYRVLRRLWQDHDHPTKSAAL